MNLVLAPSDVIEIIGIIASIATSIVAIVISLKTLKQNSKNDRGVYEALYHYVHWNNVFFRVQRPI